MSLWHDVVGGVTAVGAAFTAWTHLRAKTVESGTEVTVAKTLAEADAKRTREEEDTKRFGIKAKADTKCLDLIEAQNKQIVLMSDEFRREIVAVREEHAETRGELKHCEEKHAQALARIEKLERRTDPPPAAEAAE